MRRGAFALSVALAMVFVLAAVPAAAQDDDEVEEIEAEFKVMLEGGQEVPPVETGAFGFAEVELKVVDGFATLKFELEVCNIENAFAAHIHGPAMPGVNAGVILGLFAGGPVTVEDCEMIASGEVSGDAVSPALVESLLAGLTYVNVHTTAHPGGEIRGQLVAAEE